MPTDQESETAKLIAAARLSAFREVREWMREVLRREPHWANHWEAAMRDFARRLSEATGDAT